MQCASDDGDGGGDDVDAPGEDHGIGEYAMFVVEKWTLLVIMVKRWPSVCLAGYLVDPRQPRTAWGKTQKYHKLIDW
jgi:hypothetical protein